MVCLNFLHIVLFLMIKHKFLLKVPRSRLKQKVDQAFAVAAPRLCNLLPLEVRSAPSVSVFRFVLRYTNIPWPF